MQGKDNDDAKGSVMAFDDLVSLMVWSYKQGFKDAGEVVVATEKTIDDKVMTAKFKELYKGILSDNKEKKETEAAQE